MNKTMSVRLSAALLFAFVSPVAAQDEPPLPASSKTIAEYRDELFAWGQSHSATANPDRVRQVAAAEAAETPEGTAAMPTSTGQGSGFAGRVSDSVEDFLPLFQFALESVSTSEDQKSVTLKLNPIRAGRFGSLQLKATVTEPEPFDSLLDEIPEEQRGAQAEAIRSEIDDFSDITFSAAYNYEPEPDPRATLDTVGTLWGRNYKRYEPFVQRFLNEWTDWVVADLTTEQRATELALAEHMEALQRRGVDGGLLRAEDQPQGPDAPSRSEADQLTLGEAEALLDDYDDFIEVFQASVGRTVDDALELESLALLPFLVDNQPQITARAAYRDVDDLVGQESWTGTVVVEIGRHNFNRLVSDYRRMAAAGAADPMAEAFQGMADRSDQIRSGEKFSLTLTWVEREDYSRDYTFGEPEETVSLSLDEGSEFCGKLEWIRNATWQPIRIDDREVYPRVILSAERVWVSDDRRRDRWVASLTYNVPMEGGLSLPLSLVYANHAEFLGEPDRQFSAHLGLNFKFDAAGAAK